MGRERLVTNRRLVAIVDDEEDISNLFSDALKRIESISIVAFNDPKIALEHFKTNFDAYAVIISDFRMPEINGIELIKKVKELNPKVRTILVTAFDLHDNNDFQNFLKEGVIDTFIEKPIKINRLCQKVEDEIRISIKAGRRRIL